MTREEILSLMDYLETVEGMTEEAKLSIAVRNGKRAVESLTDRELLMVSYWPDFEDVMRFGKDDEVVEAFRLAREAITTGKFFLANRDMAEGVFRSDEDAREYAEKIRFHMYLI